VDSLRKSIFRDDRAEANRKSVHNAPNSYNMAIKIDKLIRSRRRSISLEVTRDARLVIRMPKYGSLRDVKRFVLEKRAWIEKKIAETSERIRKQTTKKFIDGEQFYYLGEKYELHLCRDALQCASTLKLEFNGDFYLHEESVPYAKSIFIKWYKRQAKLNIPKRVRWYAAQHGLEYGKIRITSASKRWGSCTAKNDLNFTWKLMLLPIKIVDYVVVHELAHTLQHNHSKRFWAEVERILPNYKERRKWLKKNGEEYFL